MPPSKAATICRFALATALADSFAITLPQVKALGANIGGDGDISRGTSDNPPFEWRSCSVGRPTANALTDNATSLVVALVPLDPLCRPSVSKRPGTARRRRSKTTETHDSRTYKRRLGCDRCLATSHE